MNVLLDVSVTALYGAISALWVLFLAFQVVNQRRKHQIGLGDEANRDLAVAIRIHGNALENILICLFLMLTAELNGGSDTLLHASGIILLGSRVAHAHGMKVSGGRYSIFRFYGTLINWILLASLAIWNLVLAL